jgi:hypothetical protein
MLDAKALRPIYERNNRNAQRTADEIGVPVTTLKSSKAYREIRHGIVSDDDPVENARRGYAPGHWDSGAAPGYLVGKVTVHRDRDGEVKQTWERQHPDADALRIALETAFDALSAKLPRAKPVAPPKSCSANLCTVYTLTDCHVGALAWHKEGGADWDLDIAEETLIGCFQHMIQSSPASEMAVVNQLGDFLHFDGLSAVTPTSGHLLDADSRFEKVVEVAIRVLRRVIALALEKHPIVRVILAEGNHDLASSAWLRQMFAVLYENEPRVTVDASPLPYYAIEWGKTLLCFHHGHLRKNDQLPLMFATQFAELWGRTTKRYCHTGHRHHLEEKEHSGMIVFQHPTLAARDAYAARGGWHALRSATAVTYHRAFGEVGRSSASPDMLLAA